MTQHTIAITYADGRTETREFSPGSYVIGRTSGDLALEDPKVSSTHARLTVSAAGVTFEDVGSTNGSFAVDGQRLSGPHSMAPGIEVRLGHCKLVLKAPAVERTQAMSAEDFAGIGATPAAVPSAQAGAYPARPPAPAALVPSAPRQDLAAGGASAAVAAPISSAPHSHPGQPVRHSYPLAIADAGLSTAFGLMMKTLPFLLARLGVLVAVTIAVLVWWGLALGGLVFFAGRESPILGYGWFVVLAVVAGWLWWAVVRYFLYLLKAAHIAVLTELITTGSVSNGSEGMFQYGIRTVKSRFGEVNVLFGLDMLVDGIVGAFNRTLDFVTGLLPVPGLDSVMGVVKAILRAATTYIDETIFSYNLARGDENVFRSSKDGLIYYAQNSKEVLKTGVWVVVLDKVLTAIIWMVMLAPAFVIGWLMPASGVWVTITAFVCAALFAGDVRAAFLRPLFLTMVMIKFHTSVQRQAINPEWDARLDSASEKFRELSRKAADWVAPGRKAEGPTAIPA